MNKYRVTQLGSLPKFRVEVWRKPWFRSARWEVVKVYHFSGSSTFTDDAEYDTKDAACIEMQGLIKDDLEDELRKQGMWQPVD